MAAGQEANGSFLQLQGLEDNNLSHAKSLAGATEQVCIRFALAIYNNNYSLLAVTSSFICLPVVCGDRA